MKSDVIHVTSEGVGVAEAIKQTEAVAAFKALSKKDSIHLLLLTEEMMGMMQALTGEREADFWIEDEDKSFALHLKAETSMTAEMREKLLSASTSGENVAAKGVMGKLRDIFSRIIEPTGADFPAVYTGGWNYNEDGQLTTPMYEVAAMAKSGSMVSIWSFNKYKESAANTSKEDWDELEKSVIANIADEIEIGIAGSTVEMVVYKKM